MPAYDAPSFATFQDLTGLSGTMFGMDASDFEDLFDATLPFVESWVAGQIGETEFDSADRTAREVYRLQDAVAVSVAIRMIERQQNQVITGTHEPLLVPDPESYLNYLRERLAGGGILNVIVAAAAQVGDLDISGLPLVQTGVLTGPEQE